MRAAGLRAVLSLLAALALPSLAAAAECRYDVTVIDASGSELAVSIECDGGLPARLGMKTGAAGWVGTIRLSDGTQLETDLDGWSIPANKRANTAQYRLDIAAMANASGRYNAALKVGDSVLVQFDSWLAVPEPAGDIELVISIALPAGGNVATSLPRYPEGYRIAASELDRAGYFVFGSFKRADVTLPAPGALATGSGATTQAHLIVLDQGMKATTADLTRWVEFTGLAAAEFWRGFPMADSFIVVVPESGQHIARGRVLPGASVTTILHVGRDMPAAKLYADSVLIHEMLHLGSPSIEDKGDWLNEGVATYYETIVRERAGWITREEVWREWLDLLPRGLDAMGPTGLEEADRNGIYWGGALFMLLADIELRESSGLRQGIEDCVRAVRDAGGTMDRDWTTKQFLDVCDRTYGNTIVSDLAARYLKPGEPPKLTVLWQRLGVSMAKDGTVGFNDAAPLATVRDAILSGGPDAVWRPVPRPGAPPPEPMETRGSGAMRGTAFESPLPADARCRTATRRSDNLDCD